MHIRNLPLLGSIFLSGLLALGACGSSSSNAPGSGAAPGTVGGTTGSLGGTTGSLAGTSGATGGTIGAVGGQVGSAGGSTGTGAGGTTVSGTCTNIPSCLQPLISCIPSGTCMQQTSTNAMTGSTSVNSCYSNGVKEIGVGMIDFTTQAITSTVTVSKNGSVCYIEAASETSTTADDVVTIKNASGATIATLSDSPDGNGTVVTCTGQAAVVVDDDCMPAGTTGTTGDCTTGTCQ